MGEVLEFGSPRRRRRSSDKRRVNGDDYVRGQQILANAIFHWKNDPANDARAAVRFLVHHLATAFRADDAPLQPRPVHDSVAPEAAADPSANPDSTPQ